MVEFRNIELHHVFSMFIKNNLRFKNKIKNIEAQIGKILRTPSLDRNLLVLIKKEECIKDAIQQNNGQILAGLFQVPWNSKRPSGIPRGGNNVISPRLTHT